MSGASIYGKQTGVPYTRRAMAAAPAYQQPHPVQACCSCALLLQGTRFVDTSSTGSHDHRCPLHQDSQPHDYRRETMCTGRATVDVRVQPPPANPRTQVPVQEQAYSYCVPSGLLLRGRVVKISVTPNPCCPRH